MEQPILETDTNADGPNKIKAILVWVKHHRLIIILSAVGIIVAISICGAVVINKQHNSLHKAVLYPSRPDTATNSNSNQANLQANCTPPSDSRYYRTDRTLAIDPQNGQHIFVAIEYKGAYQSFDGGKSWQQTLKDFKWRNGCFPEAFKALFSPTDSKVIYLSTNGDGIVKTSDGGKTWKKLFQSWMYNKSEDFVFDPTNDHTLYASTADVQGAGNPADNSPVTKGLVYKSTDSGTSWTELLTGLDVGVGNNGIAISTADPHHLLAFTLKVHFHPGGRQIDTSGQMGILESKDAGVTWSSIHTIPAGYDATSYMAYSQAVTNHIYVTSFTAPGTPEVDYYSFDFGQTWAKSDTVMAYVFYDQHDSTGLHLWGVNREPNVNTTNKFFESRNGGRNWTQTTNFPNEISNSGDGKTLISNIKWDLTNPNIVYASAASGLVWKSIDSGQTWQKIMSFDTVPK